MAGVPLFDKRISTDTRFSKLPLGALVLFLLLSFHANSKGRYFGDPQIIKSQVCPNIPEITPPNIESWLKLMSQNDGTNKPLIQMYEANGARYIILNEMNNQAPEQLPLVLLDPTLGRLKTTYEENIGMISPMTFEWLKVMRASYPESWIIKAMDAACKAEKRRPTYIEGILRRYKQEGLGNSSESPKTNRASASDEDWQYA